LDIRTVSELARNGDEKAKHQLFQWLRARFLHFAEQRIRAKDDAEDVVHSALLAISTKYRTVELERGLAEWAHGVLKKEILKYYRTKSRRTSSFSPAPIVFDPVDHQTTDPDLKHRILLCLDKLHEVNPRYAHVIQLKSHGFSGEEICKKLGVTIGNLYTIVSRARMALKRCLEKGTL
jgi:RNA polymerase sigma-70 factor (ECF subfamily)